MRRSRLAWSLVGGLVLALGGALLTVAGVRVRAQVIALKAAGKLPDLSWTELLRLLPRGRGVWLWELVSTRNPYQAIHYRDSSATAIASGAETYRRACASCHGSRAEGGTAPALRGAPLQHGSSDWALYQTLTRGIPGTAMAPAGLPESERWRIIAFLQNLRREVGADPTDSATTTASATFVPAERLLAARADSGNWLTYSGAYDGQRYSSLAQVDRSNVQRLRPLWIHQIGGTDRFETTPLAVNGILFITTPTNVVEAIDAENGTLLWTYRKWLPERLSLCCGRANRGLAILDSTLYLATLDAHLLALDARTGRVQWNVTVANAAEGYSFTSAPLAVGDLVIVGSAGGDYPTRGFIDAYEAATGIRRWRFFTIPEPGQAGATTWGGGDSWKTGGGAPWLTGSYDPTLDLVYWGVGNPNPDFNGDSRPGDNLYTNSVVALDRASGKLRWYFQFTPHDEHDWDATQIPVLVDLPGEPPLMLWANRNGFYYVLNRSNGQFLNGREFVQQTWATGLDSTGRPLVRSGSAPSREGTEVYPSVEGGTNWWSPTYSRRTGGFYVQSFDRGDVVFKGPAIESEQGVRWGSARARSHLGPGLGAIRALDGLTGARRWEFETFTSTGEYLERVGGLLSTAGDLVFGAKKDLFLALDATDGRLLWSFAAGGGIHAAPITYLVKGRQQLTIAAGQVLLTFGLE